MEFHNWVDARKPHLSFVEQDLKDAKRRISVAKGPRRKSNVNDGPAGSDDGEVEGSRSEDD